MPAPIRRAGRRPLGYGTAEPRGGGATSPPGPLKSPPGGGGGGGQGGSQSVQSGSGGGGGGTGGVGSGVGSCVGSETGGGTTGVGSKVGCSTLGVHRGGGAAGAVGCTLTAGGGGGGVAGLGVAGGGTDSLTLIGVWMVVVCVFNQKKVNPSAASRARTNAAIGASELRAPRPTSPIDFEADVSSISLNVCSRSHCGAGMNAGAAPSSAAGVTSRLRSSSHLAHDSM